MLVVKSIKQGDNTSEHTVAPTQGSVTKVMNNFFDITSVLQSIQYLYACLGFPTKAMMLKVIM